MRKVVQHELTLTKRDDDHLSLGNKRLGKVIIRGASTGAGLGLATAYEIVREHRGRIEVESVSGNGTAFRVHLPLFHPRKNKNVFRVLLRLS
jgi:signal transduction histidine kinase